MKNCKKFGNMMTIESNKFELIFDKFFEGTSPTIP
jgi:hypothetical protein